MKDKYRQYKLQGFVCRDVSLTREVLQSIFQVEKQEELLIKMLDNYPETTKHIICFP